MSDAAKIRDAAANLTLPERAELVVYLLDSLDDSHHWVDDEEAAKRSAELDSGTVPGLSRDGFRKLCGIDPSGMRRRNLRKFPYHILFEARLDCLRVIVIRHHHRNPGYGLRRR
jgi:hypothetical protein